jgi:hypothetical protein
VPLRERLQFPDWRMGAPSSPVFSARSATFGKLVQEGAFGRMHVEHLTVSCATSCGTQLAEAQSTRTVDSQQSDSRSLGPSTLGGHSVLVLSTQYVCTFKTCPILLFTPQAHSPSPNLMPTPSRLLLHLCFPPSKRGTSYHRSQRFSRGGTQYNEPSIPVDPDLTPIEPPDPDFGKKKENSWAVAWADKWRV